jgi:hypothetical protein
LTKPDNPNIIDFDLWKQAAGDRHQIGTLAGFRSEQVAGFLLECMAGFVGIRSVSLPCLLYGTSMPGRERAPSIASIPAIRGNSHAMQIKRAQAGRTRQHRPDANRVLMSF